MKKLFVLLASLFLLSCAYAESIEIIEVTAIKKLADNQDCNDYQLTVNGVSNEQSLVRCLKRVPDISSNSVLLIGSDGVARAFEIESQLLNGEHRKVLMLNTREFAFDLPEYLELRIPEVLDAEGNKLCVLGASGVVDLEVFKKNAPDRMFSTSTRDKFSKLEGGIKSRQPWCLEGSDSSSDGGS